MGQRDTLSSTRSRLQSEMFCSNNNIDSSFLKTQSKYVVQYASISRFLFYIHQRLKQPICSHCHGNPCQCSALKSAMLCPVNPALTDIIDVVDVQIGAPNGCCLRRDCLLCHL